MRSLGVAYVQKIDLRTRSSGSHLRENEKTGAPIQRSAFDWIEQCWHQSEKLADDPRRDIDAAMHSVSPLGGREPPRHSGVSAPPGNSLEMRGHCGPLSIAVGQIVGQDAPVDLLYNVRITLVSLRISTAKVPVTGS